MSFFRFLLLLIISASGLGAYSVQASVIINNTRVVYLDTEKEVSVKLSNNGNNPVLVQSWIDDGNPEQNPSTIKVPFILTPPINRLNADKSQTLRIFYTGEPLSTTEETVFWLNVLEVPAKNSELEDENTLQLAFRSRIKLFFRPNNLKDHANDAGKELVWSVTPTGLKATNLTPYHVSLSKVSITIKDKSYYSESKMISPNSFQEFSFVELASIPLNSKVNIDYINDFGATINVENTVQ
ncbi:fimbrial biogenesis chaperone [Vibrio sp. VB16]|uniref:fimbrial biogenesis chaperone n=1 Tax=Vibrio sp. VB16 TaxID=2785746 RepID=UPI00189E8998|nr:fimbria/pilus periplasmic chaperone [Vibrio sp. VB16]UGA53578.1 fimbria/pilus periplasmic chaperone [Vibrio sp. VB16]